LYFQARLRQCRPESIKDAMKPAIRDRCSYRGDAKVPPFDDRGPIVFMDGDCVLCTRTAKLIARLDHAGEFRICPIQSELGQAVLRHYGHDPDDPDSWLYLADGYAYTSMDAIIRAGKRLGRWARIVGVLQLLPRPVQDWLYRRIARNRYRLWGRKEAIMCDLPDPAMRARLLR
jgi:predicted DCC family thiol-disulfide oxidoreductase YuxK